MTPKPGIKTTEFWGTLAFNAGLLITAIAGSLPPKYAAIGAAIANGAYSVSRAIAKFK